jgi:hypothetical protein
VRDGLPLVRLRLGDEAEVARRWRPDEARRISGDEPGRTIDVHPQLGYLLFARYFGRCVVARDGSEVLCAPPPIASWRWQRFLAGRGLPIAALLRGHEVLHAGAVAAGGGVIGLVGPSGAGKSSLTVRLVLSGARFFADDVLAVDAGADVLAHPGVGVANLRVAERERLGPAGDRVLGELLGATGRGRLHYAMETAAESLPLRALYFLRPPSRAGAATIHRLRAPDPRRLLTSTFVSQVRPPDRLASLLDVCARLAADVPMFEVAMGGDEGAGELGERLWDHLCVAA